MFLRESRAPTVIRQPPAVLPLEEGWEMIAGVCVCVCVRARLASTGET